MGGLGFLNGLAAAASASALDVVVSHEGFEEAGEAKTLEGTSTVALSAWRCLRVAQVDRWQI